MPSSSEYLRPHDHASIPGDSGSDDDDLDLEELDPDTTTVPPPIRFSRDGSTRQGNYGPGIALRNLRSRLGNHTWRRDVTGSYRRGSEEDLNGLLEDQEGFGLRRSQASSGGNIGDDDAPLLRDTRRGSARSLKGEESWLRRGTQFRLPGFKSSIFHGASSRLLGSPRDDSATKPPREVYVGQLQSSKYPPNVVSNAKYTPWSFLPRTLYNEFSFFFNIYFLLVALSQIIPALRIGYVSSYIAPLAFVVCISLGKEALDDISRRRRDAEANSEEFSVLAFDGSATGSVSRSPGRYYEIMKRSRDLKVGDVLKMRKNQRLPADVVILQSLSSDASQARKASGTVNTDLIDSNQEPPPPQTDGEPSSRPDGTKPRITACDTFIRTDQLDGETDWKLRLPSVLSQSLPLSDLTRLKVTASAPDERVNEFVGALELLPSVGFYDPHADGDTTAIRNGKQDTEGSQANSAPLSIDNTAWANTVLASNTVTYAVIIYTGSQTRAALSTSPSRSKVGLLEYEINNLTKILCALTFSLSVVLVALEGFQPTNDKEWYVAIMIYLILFSTIIPMSLRVNLDMAKAMYGRFIERDKDIPGTVVRTSTIPEDLGRVEYLLSDKTGTLTQNGELSLKPWKWLV